MAHQPFPGVLLAIALVPCVLAVSAHGDSGLSAGRSHRSEPHAFQVQTLEAGDTELAPENGEGEEEGGEEEFGPRARGGWVQNQAARSKAEVERGAMDRHAPRGGRLMDPAPEKVWLKKLGQAGFLPSDETKSIRDNQGRYNTIGACQDKCLDDFGEDCLAVEWEGTDCRTFAAGECCSDICRKASACEACLPTATPWTTGCTEAQINARCTEPGDGCLKTPASRAEPSGSERAVWFLILSTDDSDGDGVPTIADQCPNTPKGREVDWTGCSYHNVPAYVYSTAVVSHGPGGQNTCATNITVDTGCPFGVELKSFSIEHVPSKLPSVLELNLRGGNTPQVDSFQFLRHHTATAVAPERLQYDLSEPSRGRYWKLSTNEIDCGTAVNGFALSPCPENQCTCLWYFQNDGVLDVSRNDEDHDGVRDEDDECPGSPADEKVTSKGCPRLPCKEGLTPMCDTPACQGMVCTSGDCRRIKVNFAQQESEISGLDGQGWKTLIDSEPGSSDTPTTVVLAKRWDNVKGDRGGRITVTVSRYHTFGVDDDFSPATGSAGVDPEFSTAGRNDDPPSLFGRVLASGLGMSKEGQQTTVTIGNLVPETEYDITTFHQSTHATWSGATEITVAWNGKPAHSLTQNGECFGQDPPCALTAPVARHKKTVVASASGEVELVVTQVSSRAGGAGMLNGFELVQAGQCCILPPEGVDPGCCQTGSTCSFTDRWRVWEGGGGCGPGITCWPDGGVARYPNGNVVIAGNAPCATAIPSATAKCPRPPPPPPAAGDCRSVKVNFAAKINTDVKDVLDKDWQTVSPPNNDWAGCPAPTQCIGEDWGEVAASVGDSITLSVDRSGVRGAAPGLGYKGTEYMIVGGSSDPKDAARFRAQSQFGHVLGSSFCTGVVGGLVASVAIGNLNPGGSYEITTIHHEGSKLHAGASTISVEWDGDDAVDVEQNGECFGQNPCQLTEPYARLTRQVTANSKGEARVTVTKRSGAHGNFNGFELKQVGAGSCECKVPRHNPPPVAAPSNANLCARINFQLEDSPVPTRGDWITVTPDTLTSRVTPGCKGHCTWGPGSAGSGAEGWNWGTATIPVRPRCGDNVGLEMRGHYMTGIDATQGYPALQGSDFCDEQDRVDDAAYDLSTVVSGGAMSDNRNEFTEVNITGLIAAAAYKVETFHHDTRRPRGWSHVKWLAGCKPYGPYCPKVQLQTIKAEPGGPADNTVVLGSPIQRLKARLTADAEGKLLFQMCPGQYAKGNAPLNGMILEKLDVTTYISFAQDGAKCGGSDCTQPPGWHNLLIAPPPSSSSAPLTEWSSDESGIATSCGKSLKVSITTDTHFYPRTYTNSVNVYYENIKGLLYTADVGLENALGGHVLLADVDDMITVTVSGLDDAVQHNFVTLHHDQGISHPTYQATIEVRYLNDDTTFTGTQTAGGVDPVAPVLRFSHDITPTSGEVTFTVKKTGNNNEADTSSSGQKGSANLNGIMITCN